MTTTEEVSVDKVYAVGLLGVMALYAAHVFVGYDLLPANDREELPNSIRQTPGGYRTYVYNSGGYMGGK